MRVKISIRIDYLLKYLGEVAMKVLSALLPLMLVGGDASRIRR
jgi:hypothetical protein